jgi:uncharacterized protein YndB with AHSA1/START domain
MDVRRESEATPTKNRTGVERRSERELVVTRTVNAPARLVFEAWTKAELFRRWWVPKSYGQALLSCEMDVRVGGQYRLVFRHEDSTMEFFGTYLEVTPHSRLVWAIIYLTIPEFDGILDSWKRQTLSGTRSSGSRTSSTAASS